MNKVCAVIITYNRKKLVGECLESVLEQSYDVSNVVIFDNASTDGTKDYLIEKCLLDDERINYIRIEKNIGPAGAFAEAYKLSLDKKCQWIWAMDDDTIPAKNCLEELIIATKITNNEKISFYASTVYGINGEFMNVPGIDLSLADNGYQGWYKYLDSGLIKINYATFVSILFDSNAVLECGVPIQEFNMWGSDSEYTHRLSKYYGPGYFVGKSIAVHKRFNVKNLSVYEEPDNKRRKQYRYLFQGAIIVKNIYEENASKYKLMISVLKEILKGLTKLGISNGISGLRERIIGGFLAIKRFSFFRNEILSQIKTRSID